MRVSVPHVLFPLLSDGQLETFLRIYGAYGAAPEELQTFMEVMTAAVAEKRFGSVRQMIVNRNIAVDFECSLHAAQSEVRGMTALMYASASGDLHAVQVWLPRELA